MRAVGTRVAGLALALLALGSLHLPGRPTSLCVLRGLTGVPCPLCGGTTAGVRLGHGDVLGALRASPLAVIGALGFALEPLGLPSLGRYRWVVVGLTALAAELWQLQRFGFL
ncbi:MAG: hypothetical protein JWM40_140 [Frankiales bacterium]|nr:hypothetical protein [Frankiales bacterium]